MKPLHLVGACALFILLSTSCDNGKKSVKEFAEKFAGYAKEDQRDSILAVYPGAELADVIEVKFNPDSLSVDKAEKEGEYKVIYGSKATMLVALDKDGKVKVLESQGIFKYSPAKMKFAKKIGALKKVSNDEELSKRMIQVDNLSTELFNEYVKSRKNAIKNLGFTVTHEPEFGLDEGKGYYTLRNTTDQPIGGDEYEITYKGWELYAGMEDEKTWTDIVPGKDIPAHGSIRLNESYTMHFSRDLQAITMHTPTQESFFKNYKPVGDEYDNYIKAHGNEVVKKGTLGFGPFVLAGKLGNKYPIHINLLQGMKGGTYYYDKYGPNATLDLHVKAYNENTGELTMDEMNNKGEVTGTFVGVLTPETYTGKMTSFQGKTYDFTLQVIK